MFCMLIANRIRCILHICYVKNANFATAWTWKDFKKNLDCLIDCNELWSTDLIQVVTSLNFYKINLITSYKIIHESIPVFSCFWSCFLLNSILVECMKFFNLLDFWSLDYILRLTFLDICRKDYVFLYLDEKK